MIELESSVAFLLYLSFLLGGLLLLWIVKDWALARRPPPPSLFTLYHCEYCLACYLEQSDIPVTKCPTCGSYNRKEALKGPNPPPAETKSKCPRLR